MFFLLCSCRFVGVHSKVVLGPLAKAGIAPSVSTVNRAIKASEVPISYGYDPARLDMVMTSAVETITALVRPVLVRRLSLAHLWQPMSLVEAVQMRSPACLLAKLTTVLC